MPVSKDNPVFINGAGIGGLTAALCLAKSGYSCTVFEQAEGFETIGAGLQLSPNANSVLFNLGLADKVAAVATEPDCIRIENGRNGRHLASLPLGADLRQANKHPYLVIHRADLQQILYAACKNHPRIRIEFLSSIVEMAPHQRGTTIAVSQEGDVSERLGSAVVIADGVWSKLRTDVLHLDPPVYSGKIAWRAMFPASAAPEPHFLKQTHVWFGPKSHVVTYPVRSGRQLNMVVITQGDHQPGRQMLTIEAGELAMNFKGWRGSFLPLLSEDVRWTGWPVFEMKTAKPMHVHGIGLLGDAAHAMLPFAAQGAAMAIEDAATLASCFNANDSADQAMADYSKHRIKRVQKVMKTARKNGQIYHLGRFESLFRDIGMRLVPTSKLSARQDWIYSWRAE